MRFQAWLISMVSTVALTCTLKTPSSRGGGGGKFPEPDGRMLGSSRGGGGGGRKSPVEGNPHTKLTGLQFHKTLLKDIFAGILLHSNWLWHVIFCLGQQLFPIPEFFSV